MSLKKNPRFHNNPWRKASCRILLLGLSLLFFAIAQLSHAEEAKSLSTEADSLPVYHLGEVVTIRADRNDWNPSQAGITANSIKTSGAATISAALSSSSGLVVTSGSKGESRLQIRGFQSQETIILLDGRPVSLPYYGDFDLTTIPVSNISRIVVVKGPVPPTYGANVMGGIVNMVSRRTTGAPFGEVQLTGGTEGYSEALFNYGEKRGQFDYWVSLGRSEADGFRLSDDFAPLPLEDGTRRDNARYRHVNVDTKLNYTLSGGTLLSVASGYYDAERSLPSGTDKAVFQRYPLWRRWYLDFGADGMLGSRVYWRSKIYYDDCENRLQRYDNADMADSNLVFDSYHDSYDIGGNISATVKLSNRLDNAAGMTVRRDIIHKQDDLSKPWLTGRTTTSSLFDQVSLVVSRVVTVEAGASLNWMDAPAVNSSTVAADPYGSLIVTPLAKLSMRGTIALATRFPTLNHLYSTTSGNPNLSSERAAKFEAGYRWEITHQVIWSQTGFLYDVNDLIDRKDKYSLYENIDEVSLKGIESGIVVTDIAGLTTALNHAYLDAWEEPPEGSTGSHERRYYTPRHKVDYTISWQARFGLELSHVGQFIADRVDTDRQPMPDYYLAHLRASQDVGAHVKLFATMRNVFDKDYLEELYYPMPGRTIMIGVEGKY